MKKSRFTDSQIIDALKRAEAVSSGCNLIQAATEN